MLKPILLGLVAALALPLAASAYVPDITVNNKTDKCAWVTIYNAGPLSGWDIVGTPQSRPRFVHPGEKYVFDLKPTHELKVRAEVMEHANCSGRHIKDTYDVRKGLWDPTATVHLTANLIPHNGSYIIWF